MSRTTTSEIAAGHVEANATTLYYERRGSGPSLLLIQGATGDAGYFEDVAQELADEFTVVTYDRRGNSRSPRPEGWTSTTIDEQADDAAALVEALGLAPAAAFGTSGGGIILMNLLLRRPEVLRGAVVHEPPLMPVLADPEAAMAGLQAMADEAMARGGPPAALEVFLRHYAGEQNFERFDPELRERIFGNAELFFGIEMEAFVSYVPDAERLEQSEVPLVAALGRESVYPELVETSRWLAEQAGAELVEVPGAHAGYFEHPREWAEALRPILRRIS